MVSSDPHRARIVLPHGFEYHEAEIGRSTVKTSDSQIALDYTDAHAHFAYLNLAISGTRKGSSPV